jgi:hypothetical protein
MRGFLLLQLQLLCDTLQFHCFSVFRRIVDRCQASVLPPQDWNIPRLWLYVNTWTKKNAVFWDIKPQFVPHRRHIMSPLQSTAG